MTTEGWTEPGFERVRAVFAKNLEDGLDVGASFSAYHRGRPVVDLWGGIADPATERAWEQDTLAVVFSTTKGITATCAHRLAQTGQLDVEAPVVEYWPEFGQAGKAEIPVSQLLSHRAGLPWVDEPHTLADVLAWDPMIRALEHQAPVWPPGTQHGYHAVTFGWLVGEVVRRVCGRSIGAYFREEIAEPLGLDFWIGLPEELEPRVATLIGGLSPDSFDEATRAVIDQFIGPDTMLGKALSVNGAIDSTDALDSRAGHAAELPATGGIGDARSIAHLYAAIIGEVDGIRILDPAQMELARTPRTNGPNTVLLGLDLQFGLGYIVPSTLVQVGGDRSFGHFGLGGSGGWCDPDAELSFGYVMNRLELGLAGDFRIFSLINACYDAIA